MNAKTLLRTALLLVPLASACQSTSSGGGGEPDMDAMMARWAEFMTPGEAHARLAPKVGTWNMKVRMYMSPDMPPDESTATSTVQWVMDGRYLQDTTLGTFNGETFHGLGLMGYDNLKKVYVGTWIDNFGTAILVSEGRYDAATKTYTFHSKSPDLMYANAYVPTRATERWIDADHWVMQSFAPGPDGKEFMGMEIEYARVR